MSRRRRGRDRKVKVPPSLTMNEIKAAQQEVQAASAEVSEARRLVAENPGWVPPVMTAVWEE